MGELFGVAFRTFVFPLLLGKLLKRLGVKPRFILVGKYIAYAIIAWPLMFFITYGYEKGLGNIILDIPFLIVWLVIDLIKSKKKVKDDSNLQFQDQSGVVKDESL